MHIKPFSIDRDITATLEMLKKRSSYTLRMDELPAIGYIAFEEELPVAVAFLRLVEGGYAQMDSLVTNPDASGEVRHRALDAITEQILLTAKVIGIKQVLAFSVHEKTLVRSKRHGFVKLPHSIVMVDLCRHRSV